MFTFFLLASVRACWSSSTVCDAPPCPSICSGLHCSGADCHWRRGHHRRPPLTRYSFGRDHQDCGNHSSRGNLRVNLTRCELRLGSLDAQSPVLHEATMKGFFLSDMAGPVLEGSAQSDTELVACRVERRYITCDIH